MDAVVDVRGSRPVARAAWMLVAALLAASPLAAQGAGEPLTLDAAFDRALAANPTIAAARLRRLADLAGVDVARERPNPEARVEFERETPTQAYGLSVPVETGGKRSRRIAVSEALVRTGEAEVAQTIIEVRAAVRRAYFARVAADARLALLVELQELATRARDAAQQRFDAGSAPRLEVLQAQLALEQADNDATAARAVAGASRAQLNALLALPLDAPVTLTTPLDAGGGSGLDEALARARTSNAELAVIARRIDEALARVALARALQLPDVVPEAQLTRGAEPEFQTGWRAAVAIAVPLFTRHRAGVRVEEALLAQLKGEREAVLTRVTGEVASAATLADAQRQQYQRYRDRILPQALEVERMAEDSYRLGQTGIAALLQALQASRDARLRSLQAGADFQSALADLERAIGAPLP